MEKEKQEEAKKQVASLFADTFHNMSQHGLQINMQKQPFQVIWMFPPHSLTNYCVPARVKQGVQRE